MSCSPNPGLQCTAFQILEPNGDVAVTVAGSTDPSLSEHGEVVLTDAQSEVQVTFPVPKLNANYRFEYLYVDSLGTLQPGVIVAVPTLQTQFGFTAELAGAAIGLGYILRWRVVVVDVALPSPLPEADVPESIYVNLPLSDIYSYVFHSPRTTETYGFSELRVENLTSFEAIGIPDPIYPMVIVKKMSGFTVKLSKVPSNSNYYLVARTP